MLSGDALFLYGLTYRPWNNTEIPEIPSLVTRNHRAAWQQPDPRSQTPFCQVFFLFVACGSPDLAPAIKGSTWTPEISLLQHLDWKHTNAPRTLSTLSVESLFLHSNATIRDAFVRFTSDSFRPRVATIQGLPNQPTTLHKSANQECH
jgi:hypothetical protein